MDVRRAPGRAKRSAIGALLTLLFLLGLSATASTAGAVVTVNQPEPVVGETLTFTSDISTDCNFDVVWRVDGTVQKTANLSVPGSREFKWAFSAAGPHTVEVSGINN